MGPSTLVFSRTPKASEGYLIMVGVWPRQRTMGPGNTLLVVYQPYENLDVRLRLALLFSSYPCPTPAIRPLITVV